MRSTAIRSSTFWRVRRRDMERLLWLPPDPAIVVIPLMSGYPAIRHLNPTICHDGREIVLATRLIAAVRRSSLRRVGSAAEQGDEITRAIDVLMAGV